MSALIPPMKQAHKMEQSQVTRTESVTTLEERSHAEVKTPDTSSSTVTTQKKEKHPKGHSVRQLKEVWDQMDKENFLRLTDTIVLSDVWVQPVCVEPSTNMYSMVTFTEITDTPNMERREASSKMNLNDLLRMMYLSDTIRARIENREPFSFDEWHAEKTACYIKKHGVMDSTNRACLCNFILVEDHDFSFYPSIFNNYVGIFFKKMFYHSFKGEDGKEIEGLDNPSIICLSGSKSTFEYVMKAGLIMVPDKWLPEFSEAQPLN